ncbi:DUF3618 domain-containing protein [Dactylosporangium matsuzakiense]|uniref:DUF3618 domain-containing protein n=1 Tax=Dactylosporangium matsuzakiense TaxID=53360 RepID=A0A9W6KKH4_9ACTN|nr:DUF3618 domain-containing protein [Dactylosporangium matsuzakiense]UWZ48752.1 DUF3618 domain-containing protein [Dactylosporangium matsuzakiense]GLL01149.1 hypothetical protein GCM10017581_028900 [Dactylosporangium matsuzakiense]
MTAPEASAVLRAEIAATRADLAGTASELAAKTEVKARAREAAAAVAGEARRPLPWAVLAAAGAGIAVIVYAVRRWRG